MVLADDDWVIVDTETTGFSRDDVIIELAVLDGSGRTLLDSLIQSPIPILLAVQRLTGITPASLAAARGGAPPAFAAARSGDHRL
jgi:DNA polymerase-3 subunit epsilon